MTLVFCGGWFVMITVPYWKFSLCAGEILNMYCTNPVAKQFSLGDRHFYYWACFSHQLSCQILSKKSGKHWAERGDYARHFCEAGKEALSVFTCEKHFKYWQSFQPHNISGQKTKTHTLSSFEGLLHFFLFPQKPQQVLTSNFPTLHDEMAMVAVKLIFRSIACLGKCIWTFLW